MKFIKLLGVRGGLRYVNIAHIVTIRENKEVEGQLIICFGTGCENLIVYGSLEQTIKEIDVAHGN